MRERGAFSAGNLTHWRDQAVVDVLMNCEDLGVGFAGVYVYACMYVCVCVYACMYVCMCILLKGMCGRGAFSASNLMHLRGQAVVNVLMKFDDLHVGFAGVYIVCTCVYIRVCV